MPATRADARPWYALGLLCAANFMVILDAQIVILALPSIEAGLRFPGGGAQWVLSAYLLSFGGLLLLGGRAADLLGRRRVFMAGTALFLLSSLFCGFAWTSGTLISARVIEGVSAAMMAPAALALVMTTFPEGAKRNKALAVWSGTGGLGATAALLIGGVLTDGLGWRWIFFLNVPVALGLLACSPLLLQESRDHDRPRAYDPAGAVTVTAAIALLVYGLVEAPNAGWTSARTAGTLAASAVLLAVFAWIETRSAAALAPPRIFRSRTLVGGNLVILFMAMAAFGMSFVVSLYAQQVLGYSPLVFGVTTAVMPIMAVVGAYTAQAIVTKAGCRPVAVGGMVLLGAGCLLLTRVSVHGSYFGSLFFGLLIFGAGLGACGVACSIAALTGAPEQDSGLASAIVTATFQIGGALGIAIVSTIAVSQTAGFQRLAALTAGFRAGFAVCFVFAVIGLLVALLLLGRTRRSPVESVEATQASAAN